MIHRPKLFLAICLFGSIVLAQAQDKRLDSLLITLANPPLSDSLHADLYRQLASYYTETGQKEKAHEFLDSLLIFSRSKKYEQGRLFYHYGSAYLYFRTASYDSITQHLDAVINIAKTIDKPRWIADASNKLAIIYSIRGQLDSARGYLHQAIQSANETKSIDLISSNMLALGNIEIEAGNYNQALHQFLAVDSLLAQSSLRLQNRRGVALHNVGIIYLEKFEDYHTALEYMEKAKEQYLASGDDSGELDSADGEIARIYTSLGRLDRADSLFDHAITGFQSRAQRRKTGELQLHYSDLKLKEKSLSEAESLMHAALQIFQEIGFTSGITNAHHKLGHYYMDVGAFDYSAEHYTKALQNSPPTLVRSNLLKSLAEVLHKQGFSRAAYDTLQVYIGIVDTLNAHQLQAQLQEIESRYQTSQKENEIISLQLDRAKQDARMQRFIVLGLITFLIISGISVFFIYRSRKIRYINDHLKNLNILKSKLFANISHEFRTPLSLIQSPIEQSLQDNSISNSSKEALEMALRNTQKLNKLVSSVSDLVKLDAGKMTLNIRPARLRKHLKIICASFESLAKSKGLAFKAFLNIGESLFYYDPNHLETIVYNLLSNAIKYTREGFVTIDANIEGISVIISIRDSGPGFNERTKSLILQRYYRSNTTAQYEGTGIGLSLVNELTLLHQGVLEVSSVPGEGSNFTVILPVFEAFYIKKGFPIGSRHQLSQPDTPARPSLQKKLFASDLKKMPRLLIVEDNEDMRLHLRDIFAASHDILLAKNGLQGLEKSILQVPDFIISDMMMPEMDGIELLKEIRSNDKTSHIPFIILTANHQEEMKLQGLTSGATDYITKPFSVTEVKLKLQNLNVYRETIRERMRAFSFLDPDSLDLSSEDQKFWRKISNTLKSCLQNPEFSTREFAQHMHMSRMQLHRKLTALTSLSTSAFLRQQRLQLAARLLRDGKSNISEVAYSCGFSNLAYFSRCFKEEYGVSPKQYQ